MNYDEIGSVDSIIFLRMCDVEIDHTHGMIL